MTQDQTHENVSTLLGAYATDAVEPNERVIVESHLHDCEVCRDEVAQHHEVVSMLAVEGGEVPHGLWDRMNGQLEETPPPLRLAPVSQVEPGGGSGSISTRALAALAALTAVAATIAAVSGVSVIRQNQKLDTVQSRLASGSIEQSAAAADNSPANRHVTLVSADGKYHLDAVLALRGQGFIVDGNLPSLGSGKSYQLWAGTGGDMISLGMLGDKAQPTAFRMPAGSSSLAVTSENIHGAVTPGTPPIVISAVPA